MLRGLMKREGGSSTHSLNALTEPQNLEDALRATSCIMDDDLEAAEAALNNGSSTYHKLVKGMVAFLRATLGFEQDVMREASDRLADAEAAATSDQRHIQRDKHAFRSSIYPVGSEYELCHAQTQLMSAVVAVLNESLTESLKGFYKLRRAYLTLDGILAAEAKYMRRTKALGGDNTARESVDSFRSNQSGSQLAGIPGEVGNGRMSGEYSRPSSAHSLDKPMSQLRKSPPTRLERIKTGIEVEENGDRDEEFYDADEDHDYPSTASYIGMLEVNGVIQNMNGTTMQNGQQEHLSQKPRSLDLPVLQPPNQHNLLDHDPDSDIFSNPIDVFIHSGANLCFGLLNVMLSMIPPSFAKLLFIIGFHGDKERGIRMLWQASKFHNVNGAFAGLIVLGYYNTFVGFSDIVPDSDPKSLESNPVDGYPQERCEALLADMRKRHPKSGLWMLEEARLNAFNKNLSLAISMLENAPKSSLKQVEAIQMFEKSLDAMYSHDYDLCSKSFISCLTLNNWSPALYTYIAGAAQIELYRLTKEKDPGAAKKHATKAAELLQTAPQKAGKKKFMARQLPFDVFVMRKVKKWEARAQELNCPFADAIGVSPIEEMIFFWNGQKRMDTAQLETSLQRLAWSESSQNQYWAHDKSAHDERAVLAILRAATLRNLERLDEAERILNAEILAVDRTELKGGLKDNWTAPVAHYEMGVICWKRRAVAAKEGSGLEEEERWVRECKEWVEKAAKWEGYELDARFGVKVATAQDTLKRWMEKKGLGTG